MTMEDDMSDYVSAQDGAEIEDYPDPTEASSNLTDWDIVENVVKSMVEKWRYQVS